MRAASVYVLPGWERQNGARTGGGLILLALSGASIRSRASSPFLDMEDVEVRFAHLLQPIRDLTKNWEVDVAAQLGEYLEEVRAAGKWYEPGNQASLPPPPPGL